MRRGESIFELNPAAHEEVEKGFELEGSNLSGVSARCSWTEHDSTKIDTNLEMSKSHSDSLYTFGLTEHIKSSLGLLSSNTEHDASNYKLEELKSKSSILEASELGHTKKLDSLHLIFNLEAGSLLPLAIRYDYCLHFSFIQNFLKINSIDVKKY